MASTEYLDKEVLANIYYIFRNVYETSNRYLAEQLQRHYKPYNFWEKNIQSTLKGIAYIENG